MNVDNIIEVHYKNTLTTHPEYPFNYEYYDIYCKIIPKYGLDDNFMYLYKDNLYYGSDILYHYCVYYNNFTLLERLLDYFSESYNKKFKNHFYNSL